MSLTDYKSPYGKAVALLQRNTGNWLKVKVPETGEHRYFKAKKLDLLRKGPRRGNHRSRVSRN